MFSTDGLLPRNTRIESLRLQNPFLAKELIDFKNQVNLNKLHKCNLHFFIVSGHRQTYQNYEQSRQKLGTFLKNIVLQKLKFSKTVNNKMCS